jgi:hypothetical protein
MSQQALDDDENEEDGLAGYKTNIYYISRRRDGEIQGKIEVKDNLVVTPARIPQPRTLTLEQIERKVSPRKVTIQTTSLTEFLSGNKEIISHERYIKTIQIKGTGCGVYAITKKEFGEIIFAAQVGHIICAKWIPYYWKSGEGKGRYCEITYFIEVHIPENSHEDFTEDTHRIEKFYRISKVEQPPVENSATILKYIREGTKVEYTYP